MTVSYTHLDVYKRQVVADSSLVLKVYYSRNQYKLSVDGVESDVYYGAALNLSLIHI